MARTTLGARGTGSPRIQVETYCNGDIDSSLEEFLQAHSPEQGGVFHPRIVQHLGIIGGRVCRRTVERVEVKLTTTSPDAPFEKIPVGSGWNFSSAALLLERVFNEGGAKRFVLIPKS